MARNTNRKHRDGSPDRSSSSDHLDDSAQQVADLRAADRRPAKRGNLRRRLLVERLSDRRVLATLTGIVFDDANDSFKREPSESALESRVVYLDSNDTGTLDIGERFQLTNAEGAFSFDDVAEGLAIVRVFNGSSSQHQTFPSIATATTPAVEIAAVQQLLVGGDTPIVVTSDSVATANLESGESETPIQLGEVTSAIKLADGRLLVIGDDQQGDTAWIVDLETTSSTPVDLSGVASGAVWSSITLGSDGTGVLLEASASSTFVRKLDASNLAAITSTETTTTVAANSLAFGSALTNRSLIASPASNGTDDGLNLLLWSNPTGMPTGEPIFVSGINEVLAYDDVTGLLAARTIDGGVSVLDVDQPNAQTGFAIVDSLPEVTGPIALDAGRELLATIAPGSTELTLIDLSTESTLATLPLSLGTIGTVSEIEFGSTPESLVIVGASGLRKVSLRQAAAHRVTVTSENDPPQIRFGFVATATNTAPAYQTIPSFQTDEEQSLTVAAPAAKAVSVDAEEDFFIVLQQGNATGGQATIDFNGGLQYQPNLDFEGTDNVSVTLHDGRDQSDPIVINIEVLPVPDIPTDIVFTIAPVPEHLPINDPVGIIEIVDPDRIPNHGIVIDNPWFTVVGNQIIMIGGPLDFETQQTIPLTVTITDPETGTEIIRNTTLNIRDQNDPITDILVTLAAPTIRENVSGLLIAELVVEDVDEEQSHFLTVDDERFIIDNFDLRLAPGASLDFEAGATVTVNVTATEFDVGLGIGAPFTKAITFQVEDVAEQPQTIALSNQTVVAETPGAEVGAVTLDGQPAPARYTLSVDDPRFEIVDGILKLIDGQEVDVLTQAEIQIEITATDTNGQFTPVTEVFAITVEPLPLVNHNPDLPEDVDFNGEVSAADALEIVRYLNTFGPGPVGRDSVDLGYDVNADGNVTALDALIVLNFLNRQQLQNGGSVGGQPEQLAQSPVDPSSAPQSAMPQSPMPQSPAPQSLPLQSGPSDVPDALNASSHDRAIVQLGGNAAQRSFNPLATSSGSTTGRPLFDSDEPVNVLAEPADESSLLAAIEQSLRLLGKS